MQFEIVAEASAGLLCRLIGLAAQQDLEAPDLHVIVTEGTMTIRMKQRGLDGRLAAILAEKMRRCIGVVAVIDDAGPAM